MIEIRNKQILVDGKPRLILCGELHYFRLQRQDWQDRIDKLKAAGCNAVASYVPWLCHEPIEGQIDLDGRTRPELDLGGFIDLCKENGLLFFVRPGPFIMAEMKNEGLPYWVYTKHPEAVPVSWDGATVSTRTLDYLAPGFLQEARHWYEAVMPVIGPRLYPNGGNIIAVQLDNEIGMLSWISNSPDLTDEVLADFSGWLQRRYDGAALEARYPFAQDDAASCNAALRAPREEYAAALMHDLGHYMRDRFARYVATLRGYAEEFGVRDVPFVINIHGTDAGRGLSFPIGISQLYESYTQAPGYLAGSDHYLGNLSLRNFEDLYLLNACMDAVNDPDQPLTSVEFECGSGDYGETHGNRNDPATADFKIRMCTAQGNRLLNYYLFAGGYNYHLDTPVGDGNDRVAFTGERHGFAAPVNPEGELDYTYDRLARVNRAVGAVADKLAAMREEHDGVAWAFIPDYYMTESRYPLSAKMKEIVENLEANRGRGAWEIVGRAMLLAGYRFGAVDIQNRPIDPRSAPVLVVASARYMDRGLQQKLVDYLRAGGGILLYGEVPLCDMEARACTLLADALGLTPLGSRRSSTYYYLSLTAEGWAAPRAELRTHFAQVLEPTTGEVLLRVYGTGEACGFEIGVGQGRAIVFATAYKCDIALFQTALERLGARAGLSHGCAQHGIFMTTTASEEGERLLHLLNLDGFAKTLRVSENGQDLLGGRPFVLDSRDGVMLPLNLRCGDVKIVRTTAEVVGLTSDSITFRLTQAQDVIEIETDREIVASEDYGVERRGSMATLLSRKHARVDDRLTVQWH